MKENIGKLLISFGKIIFGSLLLALVCGRELAAIIRGEIPVNYYLKPSMVIIGIIVSVIFMICGLFLSTKEQ